jgi:hypothetical protein
MDVGIDFGCARGGAMWSANRQVFRSSMLQNPGDDMTVGALLKHADLATGCTLALAALHQVGRLAANDPAVGVASTFFCAPTSKMAPGGKKPHLAFPERKDRDRPFRSGLLG